MIRDITLGQFYPGNSWVHRLDARVKIMVTLLYIVSIFVVKDFIGFALEALGLAVVIAISRVPLKFILRGLKPIFILIAFTFVINMFMIKGEVLVSFWIFSISREGLRMAIFMAIRLILLIIVGTLPLFAVLPIKDAVESLSGNMYFVAGALLVTGCLLFASDRVRPGRKTEKSATLLDVLLVGVAQAIATCPGISRSGTTITAGCFVGFDRRFAVRYSFLMSIPAILGANILSLKDAVTDIIWADVPVYLVGVAVAAAVGYVCIRLLKMIADKGKFGFFAYYCWAVGIVTLILTLVQK